MDAPEHRSDPDPKGPRFWDTVSPTTIIVASICILIEFVLQATDYGLLDIPRLRTTAYEFGGFWPGLLRDWLPNYPFQPVAMFLTYGFLHGGFAHLVVNMVTLFSLGDAVAKRVGHIRYALIYAASIIGGAIAFGVLSTGLRPMVGASGALFGLVGALVAWDLADSLGARMPVWHVLRLVGILILLNVVLYWALGGQLAWETHLGGFVAGFLVAFLMPGSKATG